MFLSVTGIILAAATLTGCQSAMQAQTAFSSGQGMTCDQIYNAYAAYEADRQSAGALSNLLATIDPEAGNLASAGVQSSDQYYEQVRASTNLTLMARGCQPL